MILINLFKKKDIPLYFFIALVYLYNIRSIVFPENFQQDDISELFIEKYWDICSGYVFFHFTYKNGKTNRIHDAIYKNLKGNYSAFDIVEPHKKRQGSITMVKKNI